MRIIQMIFWESIAAAKKCKILSSRVLNISFELIYFKNYFWVWLITYFVC